MKLFAGLLMVLALVSCKPRNEFEQRFDDMNDRVWVGEDFWSIPIEDWMLRDGRVQCVGKRSLMKVVVLSALIDSGEEFELSATMGFSDPGGKPGSGGFALGLQDDTDDDIRSLAYCGSGLNAGVDTDLKIFLGEEMKALPEGFDLSAFTLVVRRAKGGNGSQILCYAEDLHGLRSETLSVNDTNDLKGAVSVLANHATARKYEGKHGFWFDDLKLSGKACSLVPANRYGPILWTMYTLHNQTLKISVQMAPMGINDGDRVSLAFNSNGQWSSHDALAFAPIDSDSRVAVFKIENWSPGKEVPFRVVYETSKSGYSSHFYQKEGLIRAEPMDKPLVVGALTCQYHFGFPYRPLAENLGKLNPDLLYFSGDQIYEGNVGYGIIREPADSSILHYLGKWSMFGWAFGDLMAERPPVCTPDDHDVFQGNLWGAEGEDIRRDVSGTTGGYVQPARMVKAVHHTQTAHLPDPWDREPTGQGIPVYFTEMTYGRVSFAIVTDRGFKSGPAGFAFWDGRKDWLVDPVDDYAVLDPEGYQLLGDRQMAFLEHWAEDWTGSDMKCLLSQTLFANVATHHGAERTVLAGDLDSGGWPRTPRNKVLELLRSCFAFHICGDQHLPSIVQYGIDHWHDGSWAFCNPAITVMYERRFQPEIVGWPIQNRPDHGLPFTGEFTDGFGNPTYVYAVGNPDDLTSDPNRYKQADIRSSGFGVVRFNRDARSIGIEAYRFITDLNAVDAVSKQFPGWPLTIQQTDNNGLARKYELEEIVGDCGDELLELFEEESGKRIYSIRLNHKPFRPWVEKPGVYRIRLTDALTGESKDTIGQAGD